MKYLIIGGVAAGASAAARLRRMDEHAEIILFEKGAFISYANCGLPYYIGEVIKDRQKLLVQTADSFKQRFNIDARVQSEVTAINRAQKTVSVLHHPSGKTCEENYDKLLLAPGADPIRPPLPGIELEGIFTLRTVPDTDNIKNYLREKKARRAVVVGGGFIGLEMAENFHELGLEVHLVELANQVMAPIDYPIATMVQQHLRQKGIQLHLGVSVNGFKQGAPGLEVQLNNGDRLDTDIVLLSIGVRPDTRLAVQAGLELGPARGIKVNEFLQTSDPDIYAAGDAIEFANPISGQSMITYLAGPANKQGRMVADNMVLGNTSRYEGAINTAIVKVFDLSIATAGMAVKHLKAAGIPHLVSTTHSGSHAGYYPGAQQMTMQLAFAPDTGRLLGAQVLGAEGVDKRIDVLALLIRQGGTIADLTDFEHAYAPPFSSAKDPVNMAGFVAENLLQNRLQVYYWDQVEQLPADTFLVDVRKPEEFARGFIKGAVNIPLDELRERLHELPADRPIFSYCEAGMRGYLAQRILKQQGFGEVYNLSGGYYLWKHIAAEKAAMRTPEMV